MTAALLLALLAPGADPGHGYGYSVNRTRYYAYPSYSYVPQYSASYYDEEQVRARVEIAALTREVRDLTARLKALEQPKQGAAAPGGNEMTSRLVGVLRTNCLSCHDANPKGNKLSLFGVDGQPHLPVIKEKAARIIYKVYRGEMPPAPGQALPQETADLVLDALGKL